MNNPSRQNWSEIIDVNISHGTNQQRLNLLAQIVATGDRSLLAEYLVDLMVADDQNREFQQLLANLVV